MSTSISFVGSSFSLQSAAPTVPGTVRVRFSADPLQASALAPNDGLNPANYTLTGPTLAVIGQVVTVSGDPQSLDLILTAPLALGTWTLAAANIQTPALNSLVPPTSLVFYVTSTGDSTSFAAGAENDDSEKIIRKHLNPALKGPNWNAVIAGLSRGDEINRQNAILAFDQLFSSSSSGIYLDVNLANAGIRRPEAVGLDDERFRALGISLRAHKLTHEAVREVLEIYYGRDALHAWVETASGQPFELADGQTLDFTLDEDTNQSFSVVFDAENFQVISQATAAEVATVITKAIRDSGSQGFADYVTDPESGEVRVRIYSGSRGLRSWVRVTGGDSQPWLRFPTYKEVYTGTVTSGSGYNWVYSVPVPGTTRLTLTTVGIPLIDVTSIAEGDYVVVGAGAGSVPGVYGVSEVSFSWSGANFIQVIDLDQDIGFTGTGLQQNNDSYRFFSPTRADTISGYQSVVVAQTLEGILKVVLPATSPAVTRGPKKAAYGRVNAAVEISRIQRVGSGTVTVDTVTAHGLSSGHQVTIDGFLAAPSIPWTSLPAAGNLGGSWVSSWADTVATPAVPGSHAAAVTLADGVVLAAGGLTYVAGVGTETTNAIRFVPGAIGTIIDGSEAEGAPLPAYTVPATASMNQARQHHAMSVISSGANSGNAFTSGGDALTVPLSSCERYDPVANTWTTTAPMFTARTSHQQVSLSDGKILVCGGTTAPATYSATAEVYDPVLDTWTVKASMIFARSDFQAVLLSDGKVLVMGGRVFGAPYLDVTETAEIYDPVLNTWTRTGNMQRARASFLAVNRGDDVIIAVGGLGYDRSAPSSLTGSPPADWPMQSLAQTEVWDLDSGSWHPGNSMSVPRHDFVSASIPGKGLYLIGGGTSNVFNVQSAPTAYVNPDNRAWEYLNLDQLSWTLTPLRADHPSSWTTGRGRDWAAASSNDLVVSGGGIQQSSGNSFTGLQVYVPGSDRSSGGGINGTHAVTVSSSTRFTFETPSSPFYTSNFGSSSGGGADFDAAAESFSDYSSSWTVISSGVRTSNVTTLTLSSTSGISVGDRVYVNAGSASFTSGVKTVTAVGTTSISYVEVAADIGATALNGGLSLDNGAGTATTSAAAPQPVQDPGPFVFEHGVGLPVVAAKNPGTGSDVVLTSALVRDLQYTQLVVDSTSPFPDQEGFIVLDFGGPTQSKVIRYLEKISSTILLLDYNYVAEQDWPAGTAVTLLAARAPQPAPVGAGSFYATDSNAGRVAAQNTVRDITASGLVVDFDVVYPGDRGLGGEGLPTEGSGKLSDRVRVWGPADLDDLGDDE